MGKTIKTGRAVDVRNLLLFDNKHEQSINSNQSDFMYGFHWTH